MLNVLFLGFKKQYENAWKYANVLVKKKAEWEKLKGFAYDDCEQYYKNANLTNKQLQKLLQKCSKHRVTIVPDRVRFP